MEKKASSLVYTVGSFWLFRKWSLLTYVLYQESQQWAGAVPWGTYDLRLWPHLWADVCCCWVEEQRFLLCVFSMTYLSVSFLCCAVSILCVPQADSRAPFFYKQISEFSKCKKPNPNKKPKEKHTQTNNNSKPTTQQAKKPTARQHKSDAAAKGRGDLEKHIS